VDREEGDESSRGDERGWRWGEWVVRCSNMSRRKVTRRCCFFLGFGRMFLVFAAVKKKKKVVYHIHIEVVKKRKKKRSKWTIVHHTGMFVAASCGHDRLWFCIVF
jgi:hypothetical protein